VADLCEHGNEASGSIRKQGFLTSRLTVSFSNNILHHGVSYLHLNTFIGISCFDESIISLIF
jgi:hypothetical protein